MNFGFGAEGGVHEVELDVIAQIGTALGAAAYVANELGDPVKPMQHAYLGPRYTTEQCIEACRAHEKQPTWEHVDDVPERAAQIRRRVPLGRFGLPVEIGNAVAFLASEDAAYITGQVLAVDGGLVMMSSGITGEARLRYRQSS